MTDKPKYILCVGICVVDIIHVSHHYPKEDTKNHGKYGTWQRGGNASNNCTVLRRLGATCEFLGMLSSTPAFDFLNADCRHRNIDIHNCPFTDKDPPVSSIILVESKGTRTIVHSDSDFPKLTYKHFKKIDLSLYSWIHFEGRNPEEVQKMINMIQKYNKKAKEPIKVTVELERLDNTLFSLCTRADVVFIGKHMAVYQGWSSAREAVFKAQMLIIEMQNKENLYGPKRWPWPCIVSTWGAECTDCLTSKGEYVSHPAIKVAKVVDSLGVGSAFVAGFIYGMHNLKLTELEAVNFGNQVAAYKVQHAGYDSLVDFEQRIL